MSVYFKNISITDFTEVLKWKYKLYYLIGQGYIIIIIIIIVNTFVSNNSGI